MSITGAAATTTITSTSIQEEQVEEILNPLVFQCLNCKSIIGDSFAWLNADQELNSITLTAKSKSVAVDDSLQFSSDGVDKGRYLFNPIVNLPIRIIHIYVKT
jgi:hypothetical protein